MNAQFKKGALELCVLAILSEGDCYGYDLVTQISEHISITEGTIYPLLRRLKDDGQVETYLQESSSGPPRPYYRTWTRSSCQFHPGMERLRRRCLFHLITSKTFGFFQGMAEVPPIGDDKRSGKGSVYRTGRSRKNDRRSFQRPWRNITSIL